MKTFNEIEEQRLRALMRSHAMEYRKAIHPEFAWDWNTRIRWGMHGLRIAKFYRKMAGQCRLQK